MNTFRAALLATAVFVSSTGLSLAQPAAPRSLPAGLKQQGSVVMMAPISDSATSTGPVLSGERRTGTIRVLSGADHELYLKAFDAADRGDWTAARGLAGQGHDPIARRIIEWRYLLDKNSGASFGEISAFLKANPDWPARDALFARGEAVMDPNLEPHAVVAFFEGRDPASDIGKVRLGEAYLAKGDVARGRDLIRQAWMNGSFDLNQEFDIIRRHGDILTPDVDRERLNRLLFNNDITAAKREMARVPNDIQQLADARLALRDNPWRGQDMVARLPAALQNDPGLLIDRARLLRQQNVIDAIPPLLSRAPTRDLAAINPGKWWSELNQAARAALQLRSYRTAHQLVAYSGLSSGSEFADAEFLAGWLDLRFLDNPREAHTHFTRIANTVTRPISRSRGYYWAGRASEAAGDTAQAWQDYHNAAQFSGTFYGQVALAKLTPAPTLHLQDMLIETAESERANYERHELTRAMHVLGDLGMVGLLRTFATYDAETHSEPKHLKLLASDLASMGFKDVAVRVAKTASYNGTNLFAYSHPVVLLPGYAGPGYTPESAFVLGIIRQETEFDPMAVSGSGARGLMQLMPASAKRDADLSGMPYRPNDLLNDTTYNIRLGMVELADDLVTYGGSYILAAAAYNAGKANVNKWLDLYGDPRGPAVDPIDWIEQIPFTETRNYVQRVIENIEVYRNRLSGRDEPLRILADIYRPRVPNVRPLTEPGRLSPRADTAPAGTPLPAVKPIKRPS
ncbi:MAG TPA: transglycosylase SLT domain-containing protein [Rhizomicrobium sp.]|jgi:soluble lytic murein transglycosylase|nr:transglycosylase SLT domain-containing protein [Rhizomicrobium sp.]